VLVNNEGLTSLSLHKIQSDVIGNSDDLSFDGDEMNLHMPQDPESEAELKNLAAVPYQIVSPANNSSIIDDRVDYRINLSFIKSSNVDEYFVYINDDYYGQDVQTIQLNTGDLLRVEITKETAGQEALIEFEAKLV
jgi:hypothetical protein